MSTEEIKKNTDDKSENAGGNKEINENQKNKLELPYIEKENGDVKFQEKNYDDAMKHYSKALMGIKILIDDKILITEEEVGKYIKEIGMPCNSKLSFCYMKKEDWKNVIYYCNKVIELEGNCEKALYRRCHAYIKLNELDNAQNDLKSLEKLISGQKEFDDLKKIYEDMKASSKLDESQLYKKMFKQYKNNLETRESEENKKRVEGLISKLPRAAISLFKLSLNYTVFYPMQKCLEIAKYTTDLLVFRPFNYTLERTKNIIVSSKDLAISFLNQYYPLNKSKS